MWPGEKRLFPALINESPCNETGIIVVVPSYNEPDITKMLDSLASCQSPRCRTEILVVINAPPGAPDEAIDNNTTAIRNIRDWIENYHSPFFKLYIVDLGQPAYSEWGVGMARKAGMDEALLRFQATDRRDGVIVSLDADCTVEQNYFQAIENELLNRNDRKGCSIYFEHPLSGQEYPEEVYNAIARYELHLRYYYQALKHTGYPWVYYTIGSCMAVKASSYIRAGGMNRRQAGEDFYFIQKLLPAGGYFSLNTTTVYPSPRSSERVPFGTGAIVSNMLNEGPTSFLTFNPEAFEDLRHFFTKVSGSFSLSLKNLMSIYNSLPCPVRKFLSEEEWNKKISEVRLNTSSPGTFSKRFFGWFNMFRIIKFLNFVHSKGIYQKLPPDNAVAELFRMQNKSGIPSETRELVKYLRRMEKAE
ncbi:MAG: glycosyltransferase [Bacteroidales bacterium]